MRIDGTGSGQQNSMMMQSTQPRNIVEQQTEQMQNRPVRQAIPKDMVSISPEARQIVGVAPKGQ